MWIGENLDDSKKGIAKLASGWTPCRVMKVKKLYSDPIRTLRMVRVAGFEPATFASGQARYQALPHPDSLFIIIMGEKPRVKFECYFSSAHDTQAFTAHFPYSHPSFA